LKDPLAYAALAISIALMAAPLLAAAVLIAVR
jgi:hypothetical protein